MATIQLSGTKKEVIDCLLYGNLDVNVINRNHRITEIVSKVFDMDIIITCVDNEILYVMINDIKYTDVIGIDYRYNYDSKRELIIYHKSCIKENAADGKQ